MGPLSIDYPLAYSSWKTSPRTQPEILNPCHSEMDARSHAIAELWLALLGYVADRIAKFGNH
jgi:hypothetical protein